MALWSARFLSHLLKFCPPLFILALWHLAESNILEMLQQEAFRPQTRLGTRPTISYTNHHSESFIFTTKSPALGRIWTTTLRIDKKLPTNYRNYLVKIFNTRTRQKQRKCVVSRRFLCRWQPLNWRTMLCDSFHLWSLWWSLCEFSEFSRNPPSWEPPVSQALAKLSGKVHVWQLHTLSQPQEHSSRGPSCSNLCWQTTWRNVNGDKIGLLCFVCPENTNH